MDNKKAGELSAVRLIRDVEQYRRVRWALAGTLAILMIIPGAIWLLSRADATVSAGRLPLKGSIQQSITASGRIQPKDGVITIAAPTYNAGPSIVSTLDVQQGDRVVRDQLLATLSGKSEIEAALASAEQRLRVAHLRLSALKAGGKAEDLDALRFEIKSDQATLAQIDADARRERELYDKRVVALASMEAQQARLAAATRSLDAKRARLKALSSVRPADVAVSEAGVDAAEAEVREVQARLEHTLVRAPADGRILAIYAHPGQNVGAEGLLAFGRTSEMYVEAEVVEEDVGRTRIGQKVRISGEILGTPASGRVEEIGYLVGTREIFRSDPTAFADSRVVRVKIRADQPALLERFVNARVTVEIEP